MVTKDINKIIREEKDFVAELTHRYGLRSTYRLATPKYKLRVQKLRRITLYASSFQCNGGRPNLEELKSLDRQAEQHYFALNQDTVNTKNVLNLVGSLRPLLLDIFYQEYCKPSFATSDFVMWKRMGVYLSAQNASGDARSTLLRSHKIPIWELDTGYESAIRVLDESLMNKEWVKKKIGSWACDEQWDFELKRLSQACLWEELATKLLDDEQRLREILPPKLPDTDWSDVFDKTNLNMRKGRLVRRKIAHHGALYFYRLESPTDFRLTSAAKKLELKRNGECCKSRRSRLKEKLVQCMDSLNSRGRQPALSDSTEKVALIENQDSPPPYTEEDS